MSSVIAIEKNKLGYQVFFLTPGVMLYGGSPWMSNVSLRKVFEACEKRGALIAYIIDGKKLKPLLTLNTVGIPNSHGKKL